MFDRSNINQWFVYDLFLLTDYLSAVMCGVVQLSKAVVSGHLNNFSSTLNFCIEVLKWGVVAGQLCAKENITRALIR